MIPVTKTFLPPIEEYIHYLEKIWANQLTNNGPLVQELEAKLKLPGCEASIFVSNGTIALQIAIKALDRKRGYYHSFSYVATTSSLVWEGCQPVSLISIHIHYVSIKLIDRYHRKDDGYSYHTFMAFLVM